LGALSKNKGKIQVELKDIQPIMMGSQVTKILEKPIMAKGAIVTADLLLTT
jgi:hypothetical protein